VTLIAAGLPASAPRAAETRTAQTEERARPLQPDTVTDLADTDLPTFLRRTMMSR
jgi:hypothetical protein